MEEKIYYKKDDEGNVVAVYKTSDPYGTYEGINGMIEAVTEEEKNYRVYFNPNAIADTPSSVDN